MNIKLDKWIEIRKNCDDSHLALGIISLTGSILIALSIVLASLFISVSLIWGWVGFVSLIGLIVLICFCARFIHEE